MECCLEPMSDLDQSSEQLESNIGTQMDMLETNRKGKKGFTGSFVGKRELSSSSLSSSSVSSISFNIIFFSAVWEGLKKGLAEHTAKSSSITYSFMLACVQVQPCQRREVFFKVEFIHPVLLNCNVSILKTLQEEKIKKCYI